MGWRLGWALLLGAAAAATAWADPAPNPRARRSGFEDMGPATQGLQRDDRQNPAWLWVADGQRRFEAECQRCHSADSLRGAASRHPAWDERLGRALSLAARINQCRVRHLRAPPWAPESDEGLAVLAYVALQSRGLPIQPDAHPAMAAVRRQGEALFGQRLGQLDFSCAQCHEQHAGGRLAGAPIPQGHPTGYPLYRLEWQGLGSLQRRLRNCMVGVRAEPYLADSAEFTALEAHLMARAAGMPLEAPAVRP